MPLCNSLGYPLGLNSKIYILRSQVKRMTLKSRTLSKFLWKGGPGKGYRGGLCFSAVDAQTGPVVRHHQEVLVHGFTEPSSVQLWRNNGGHLS